MFVYIIRNSVNNLYVGISENPQKRIEKHNHRIDAKFTKYVPNFKIVFLDSQDSIKDARKREIQIKKWSRKKKEFLIEMYYKNQNTKQ